MMQVQGIGNTPYQPVNPIQPITIKVDLSGVQKTDGTTPVVAPETKPVSDVQPQQQTPTVYNYPTKSVYDMPQSSVYGPNVMTNPIKAEQNKENPAANVIPAQLLAPAFTQATAAAEPVVQTKAAEAVSAVAPTEVKAQIKAETKEDKSSQIAANEEKTIKKPEIAPPEPIAPIVDLDALVSILESPNYEDQANAMEAVSQVVLTEPEKAQDLIDPKVLDTLLNIMNKDTSALDEKEKAYAERNKQYAIYTTATLQKLYTDEVQKAVGDTVPMEEVVGMAGVVNELKTNQNPQIRNAAVTALDYIKRPEYKQDLAQLFSEAAKDKDESVRKNALTSINTLA